MTKSKHHHLDLNMWEEINLKNSLNTEILQNHLTVPETKIKKILDSDPFEKYKFQCKHPVGPYIVDFYSRPLKLIIEVEGNYKDEYKQIHYYNERINFFDHNNIRLIAFSERLILDAPTGLSQLLLELLESGFPPNL